jgi:hypothetical protein
LSPIPTGSSLTYEQISKQYFNEIQALYDNPRMYSKLLQDDSSITEALLLSPHTIYWNEGLASAAKTYLNKVSPCGVDEDILGFNLLSVFDDYISVHSGLAVLKYKGTLLRDGHDLLITMLED